MTPALHVVLELEDHAALRVVADSFDDEQRIRLWLARPATRRRLIDAITDMLEELEREAA